MRPETKHMSSKSRNRLKRAYDLLQRPTALRSAHAETEIFKLLLAEIQELHRRLSISEQAQGRGGAAEEKRG